MTETDFKGIAASPGLAVGRVCFWNDPEAIPRHSIKPERIKEELQRLDETLEQSRNQIEALRLRVENELGPEEAGIFSSHNMLLDDPSFYAQVEKKLINQNVNLEAAVEDAIEEMAQIFLKISDPYLRERANDYRDVGRRVLDNLISYQRQCTMEEGELVIMVARELMPSDTVHFHRHHVGAFVTEQGGVSSHAAILARSLRLPAVVSIPQVLTKLRSGARVLVDGTQGIVIIDPTSEQMALAKADEVRRSDTALQERAAQAAHTSDGVEIHFSANLTREDEVADAIRVGALGVGLLRTEFLFMDRGEFLNEDEQFTAYKHVVEQMAPQPVTIRTLDLGEDKHFDFDNPVEEKGVPCVLGWRSIRLSLAHEKIFISQLKAMIRAAVHGPIRILLPMINGVEELRLVKQLLSKAEQELEEQGIAYQTKVPIGAMVETPASAVAPEILLTEADFLSVGTNDLVQYVMVADRVAERMQRYYRSCSPIILKLLKGLATAAQDKRKDISICGEIAGDPLYLPLLLGLGFRNFSVAPVLLLDLANSVEKYTLPQCETLAEKALQKVTADEVEALLRSF
jgi:phosphoenolpyruvate-protein phosphotransferase (PTS system enzyme I)